MWRRLPRRLAWRSSRCSTHRASSARYPTISLIEAANTGMLPLSDRNGVKFVVAPRLVDSRRLVAVATSGTDMARRIRLTSTARLHDFVARHSAQEIERRAVDDAAQPSIPNCRPASAVRAATVIAGLSGARPRWRRLPCPARRMTAAELMLGAVFLAWTGLRLLGLLSERFVRRRPRTFSDGRAADLFDRHRALSGSRGGARPRRCAARAQLPARKARHQIRARARRPRDARGARAAATRPALRDHHRARQRPAHQAEGAQRRAAVRARHLHRGVRRRGPAGARPASPRARGVRGQRRATRLRAGAAHHRQHRRQLAHAAVHRGICRPVRRVPARPRAHGGCRCRSAARRTISAPRCCARSAPGTPTTSPRTPTSACGLRASAIAPRSSPRPPTRRRRRCFGPWLRQRTRWFKGWMQTWLVHMRSPLRLARELGLPGFAVFQLLVGGTVLAALIHVLFAARLIWMLALTPIGRRDDRRCCWASTPSRWWPAI